ncbi:MAG TPA: QsdR family transcriptional regulator [Solirubrobacteraceae bacterium]|nr:QsdR family transcriptional regulator [Solirubrobacteraceae bacterium]
MADAPPRPEAVPTAEAPPSPALSQALAGTALSRTVPTPAAAFAQARVVFQSGERLDMGRLADELGVARTTLYRWTGDRDRLLADVLWAETKTALDALEQSVESKPYPHAEAIAMGFIDILCGAEPVRSFLRTEGQRALLALTVPSSVYRSRLLDAVTEIIEDDVTHGYTPPETPRLLADTVISMTERFLHNGGEPDANPSPEMAKRAIALLLRE